MILMIFNDRMNHFITLLVFTLISFIPLEAKVHLIGSLVLPLPKDCPDVPSDMVFDGSNGNQCLYVLNELERRIDVFDLKDKSFRILELDPKPDYKISGIGAQGAKVFLYDYKNTIVYHYENGHLINQYSVRQEEIIQGRRMIPYPFVQTLSPIKVFGETVIMTGFRPGESMRSPDIPEMALCLLDLKSGRVISTVEMPDIYGKYNWGGGTYRLPSFDLGPDGEVVCCFAASDELTAYALRTGRSRHIKAPSKHFGQITPYSKTNRKSPDAKAQMTWYRDNPSYDGILFDPWREVYYRFALLPERPDRRGSRDFTRKPVSIIVLDKNLQPIEETLLDEDVHFRPYCSFVSQDGLFLQVLTGDEDNMTFYQFQYEKDS